MPPTLQRRFLGLLGPFYCSPCVFLGSLYPGTAEARKGLGDLGTGRGPTTGEWQPLGESNPCLMAENHPS